MAYKADRAESGSWAGEVQFGGQWRLTTDHAAASYGQAVLVGPDGRAYGPGEVPSVVLSEVLEGYQSGRLTAAAVERFNEWGFPYVGLMVVDDGD